MSKVIKELVTRWTYKVDAKQIMRATQSLKSLRGQLSGVRKSSVAFGNKETAGLRRLKRSWDSATVSARRYGKSVALSGAGGVVGGGGGRRGFFGGRRGGGGTGGGGGFGSRAGSLASVAGAGSLGAFGIGAAGVAVGGSALLTGSILKLAGAREQAEISFTGFLKSGEKAKEMLNDLTQFAKKTPFQIPELRDLSSALLAGGFAAEEVIPSLRTLGDVTRGNSDKLNRMLLNFIQIKTVGKASALDLKQFALAGIPIYTALQKVTGKNGEQLRDMGKQGKITFKIVKEAFASLTGEGGLFFQAMELQSTTFFGRLSNIKDGLIDIGETMGMEILPEAKDIAKTIQEWLGENKVPIVEQFRNFIENMTLLKDSGFNLLKDLGLDNVGALKIAALGFVTAISPMTAAFFALIVALEDYAAFKAGNPSLIGDLIKMAKGLDFADVLKGAGISVKEGLATKAKTRKSEGILANPLDEGGGFLDWLLGTGISEKKVHEVMNKLRTAGAITNKVRSAPGYQAPSPPSDSRFYPTFGESPSASPSPPNTTVNQTNNIVTRGTPAETQSAINKGTAEAVKTNASN